MGKVSDDDTKTILKNLGILIFLFYAVYYILSAIFTAAFDVHFNGKLPFDWDEFGFGNDHKLASWLSLVITYFIEIFILFFIVKSTKNSWDYAITVSFLHFIVTCLVTLAFPVNYVWWVTFLVATGIVCVVAELACYFLRDLQEIKVFH